MLWQKMSNCINCGINIEEQIFDAIVDSREDNHDGYYGNDSSTSTVMVNCTCGCLNEIEYHKETNTILDITKG